MASKKFTPEERREKAREIAEFIINEDKQGRSVSTRSLAKVFNLSNYTISTLMGGFLEKNFPGLYPDVHRILQGNTGSSLQQAEPYKQKEINPAHLLSSQPQAL